MNWFHEAPPCSCFPRGNRSSSDRTEARTYPQIRRGVDCALEGERRLLVPMKDMDRVNADEMDALAPATGPQHIQEFSALAHPAGVALGVEALEFNVHAWDFDDLGAVG